MMKFYYSNCLKTYLSIAVIGFAFSGFAQKNDSIQQAKVDLSYGRKGFTLQTSDKRFLIHLESRLQFRFATPQDQDPVTFDDFAEDKKRVLKINRARLKVGGNAFAPWLKYYWEYELSQSNLLNYTVNITKWPWLSFQLGQWKVEYSQERRISSGEQQLVDRSIINRPFTLDRQQGVEIYGRLNPGKIADISYWFGTFTGTGRGSTSNDDNKLMYFGRLQWNFLGEDIGFEGSDLEITNPPAAFIAINAATNQSAYTRFSQAGGGALEGFEDGLPGQYRVNQANIETAFKYKGFSWQTETHWKEIIDKLNNDNTTVLFGYYLQGGYLFNGLIEKAPGKLELAARHANYLPNRRINRFGSREAALTANWYFKEHRNKLSAEATYFDYTSQQQQKAFEWRFRLQWDISF